MAKDLFQPCQPASSHSQPLRSTDLPCPSGRTWRPACVEPSCVILPGFRGDVVLTVTRWRERKGEDNGVLSCLQAYKSWQDTTVFIRNLRPSTSGVDVFLNGIIFKLPRGARPSGYLTDRSRLKYKVTPRPPPKSGMSVGSLPYSFMKQYRIIRLRLTCHSIPLGYYPDDPPAL